MSSFKHLTLTDALSTVILGILLWFFMSTVYKLTYLTQIGAKNIAVNLEKGWACGVTDDSYLECERLYEFIFNEE